MLPVSFFERNTETVAKELLGKILARRLDRKVLRGKIVETEAYFGPNDPASHAFRLTPRSKIMWGSPGTVYVYFTYGNHFMLNIITEKKGTPGAVLIRALEPIDGIEEMKMRRKTEETRNLTNGPGKLTQALGIDKKNNWQMLGKEIFIEEGKKEKFETAQTGRIGIKQGAEMLLRFYIKGNEWVSRK